MTERSIRPKSQDKNTLSNKTEKEMSENNESLISNKGGPGTADEKKIDRLTSIFLEIFHNINTSPFKRQPTNQTTLKVQDHLFSQKEKRAQTQN